MIDIELYRSRIGCFCSSHSCYSDRISTSQSHNRFKNVGVFTFCITFIVVVGFTHLLVHNPGIESNPGPSFNSSQERSAYLKLKSVYVDISQVSCHQVFLRSCNELGVIPRGFWNGKLSVATCKPSKEIEEALRAINASSAKEKVRLHIDYYE